MTSPEKTVQVAVVQAGAIPFDTEACIDKAVRLIGEAAATGAKVIVFPEAFITGYPKGMNYGLVIGARDPVGREEFRLYLEQAIEVPGAQTQRIGAAALELDDVAGGLADDLGRRRSERADWRHRAKLRRRGIELPSRWRTGLRHRGRRVRHGFLRQGPKVSALFSGCCRAHVGGI